MHVDTVDVIMLLLLLLAFYMLGLIGTDGFRGPPRDEPEPEAQVQQEDSSDSRSREENKLIASYSRMSISPSDPASNSTKSKSTSHRSVAGSQQPTLTTHTAQALTSRQSFSFAPQTESTQHPTTMIQSSHSFNVEVVPDGVYIVQYDGVYHAKHPAVQAFWEAFHELSLDERKKFLQFLSGSTRLPVKGMKDVKVKFQPCSDEALPVAHTCANTLDLPNISDKKEMLRRLRISLEHTSGFTLV
ncbi:unnamed protein product, partial [Mesorhabditis spiculigera]